MEAWELGVPSEPQKEGGGGNGGELTLSETLPAQSQRSEENSEI